MSDGLPVVQHQNPELASAGINPDSAIGTRIRESYGNVGVYSRLPPECLWKQRRQCTGRETSQFISNAGVWPQSLVSRTDRALLPAPAVTAKFKSPGHVGEIRSPIQLPDLPGLWYGNPAPGQLSAPIR